eukprot:SM000076S21738  [mRNA]  locus=s76:7152:8656:+ [translate_table: standard]
MDGLRAAVGRALAETHQLERTLGGTATATSCCSSSACGASPFSPGRGRGRHWPGLGHGDGFRGSRPAPSLSSFAWRRRARRNGLVKELAAVAEAADGCGDARVPLEVVRLIDEGRNPDSFTRDLLQACAARNQATKGRVDAFKVHFGLTVGARYRLHLALCDYRSLLMAGAELAKNAIREPLVLGSPRLAAPAPAPSSVCPLLGAPASLPPLWLLLQALRSELIAAVDAVFPEETEAYRSLRSASMLVQHPHVSTSLLVLKNMQVVKVEPSTTLSNVAFDPKDVDEATTHAEAVEGAFSHSHGDATPMEGVDVAGQREAGPPMMPVAEGATVKEL